MRLHEVSRTWKDGRVRLSALVSRDGSPEASEVYFEYPEKWSDWVPESADPFLPATLIPAMFWNEDLQIDPPVSPRMLRQVNTIRDALSTWRPQLHRISITATPGSPRQPDPGPCAAAFFSSGVDSLFTAMKRSRIEPGPEPLTHLIMMRGIETPLNEIQEFEATITQVRSAAKALDLELLAGETNIRTYFNRHWERYYAGSGLAATALSLSGGSLSVVYIPSSSSYASPHYTGTNFLTDEKYSSESMEIVWDGAEAGRADKVRCITEWDPDIVQAHLRVCIRNNGGCWNCGECYKCARTSVVLALLDQLPETGMFRESPENHWRRVLPQDHPGYNREALDLGERLGTHPEITRMIERIVRRRDMVDAAMKFAQNSPASSVVPALKWIRDKLGIPARER